MSNVVEFRQRQRPAATPRPSAGDGRARYEVAVGRDGLVSLVVDGVELDVFEGAAATRLARALDLAAETSRARDEVLAGAVTVACGRRRIVGRLVEHRGTAALVDLGTGRGPLWFALTDGAQITRSPASRRWSIEAPHLRALRQIGQTNP